MIQIAITVVALSLTLLFLLSPKQTNNPKRQPPRAIKPWWAINEKIFRTWTILTGRRVYLEMSLKHIGSFFQVSSFLGAKYFASGPELNKQIWKGHTFEAHMPPHFRSIMGSNSITLQQGKKHKRLRRILGSAFTVESLSDYMPLVQDRVCSFIQLLVETSEKGPIQAYPLVKAFTMDIICTFIFSTDRRTDQRFKDIGQDFIDLIAGFGSLIHYELPGTAFKRAMQARRRIISLFEKLLNERRNLSTGEVFKDTLSKLLDTVDEDGTCLSDEEIYDALIGFAFAGHDTSTVLICNSMYVLDHVASEDCKQKLTTEILQAFPLSRDLQLDLISYEEIIKLPYLEAFVKELLRYKAIVPAMMRIATEDTTLQCPMASGQVEEFDITQGERLNLDYSRLMMNPKYFTKPTEFEPERFLEGRKEDLTHPNSFVPFGGGSRICLGMSLAKLEIKLFLVSLLRQHRVRIQSAVNVMFPMNFWKPELSVYKL